MAGQPLSLGQCATLAIILEASAPKPGNVHPGAEFANLAYMDFLASAVAVGPVVGAAAKKGLGQSLLEAVNVTQRVVATNTNLGTLLLIIPLAMIPRDISLAAGIGSVLTNLTAEDAALVYQAIGAAQAGGLGEVEEHDVAGPPPADLIAAMQLAADRDLVARQYTNDFQEVLEEVVPALRIAQAEFPLSKAIVQVQLQLLAQHGDSLVLRKCGSETNEELQRQAAAVLAADKSDIGQKLTALDVWLRLDGHRRNPGTTADLIAAGLFCLLRDNEIPWPLRFERSHTSEDD